MIAVYLAALALTQTTEDGLSSAAEAWVKCVDGALTRTAVSAGPQARIDEAVRVCAPHEGAFEKITQQRLADAGAPPESAENQQVLAKTMNDIRAKVRSRLERQLAQQPMELWNGLVSGTPSQVVLQQLAQKGLTGSLGKPDEAGWSTLRVKERVPVSGQKASVALTFYRDKLFWIEVRYTEGTRDDRATYDILIKALSSRYGQPVENEYLGNLVHASTAGTVFRRYALFKQSGLDVDVTVNSVARYRMGDTIFSDNNVILKYWRSNDADGYTKAVAKNRREQEEDEIKRAREGL